MNKRGNPWRALKCIVIKKSDGIRCKNWVMIEHNRCSVHGARSIQKKKMAALRNNQPWFGKMLDEEEIKLAYSLLRSYAKRLGMKPNDIMYMRLADLIETFIKKNRKFDITNETSRLYEQNLRKSFQIAVDQFVKQLEGEKKVIEGNIEHEHKHYDLTEIAKHFAKKKEVLAISNESDVQVVSEK